MIEKIKMTAVLMLYSSGKADEFASEIMDSKSRTSSKVPLPEPQRLPKLKVTEKAG